MTNPPSISRPVWLAFGASVVLFGIVWWIANYASPEPPVRLAEFAALNSECARLQGNDDRVRDRLREQQRGLTRIAWTPATLAALQQRQGAGWRWTWEPGDPPNRVTLQRVAPRIEARDRPIRIPVVPHAQVAVLAGVKDRDPSA